MFIQIRLRKEARLGLLDVSTKVELRLYYRGVQRKGSYIDNLRRFLVRWPVGVDCYGKGRFSAEGRIAPEAIFRP
jgi:hypothetical protein